MSDENTMVSILSIDAWGNAENGFEWNNWYKIGQAPIEVCNREPAEVIEYLIGEGILSDAARTLATVEDDQYNIVICDEDSRPCFAIAYGEAA
jgi:hypothetical protein